VTECPNLTRFLTQLRFSLELENQIMGRILDGGEEPRAAALAWLVENPEAVSPWIAGVTTRSGGDATLAVDAVLVP
jgi:glycine betaine/proline transport system substrate-binding protein